MMLAQTVDTWGISGSDFLGWYGAAAVGAIILTALLRSMAKSGGTAQWELEPAAVGYLQSGPDRAFLAEFATLRAAGQVDVSGRGSIVSLVGPECAENSLQGAILTAARYPSSVTSLQADQRVRQELEMVQAYLQKSGLLMTPSRRAVSRMVVLIPLAVIALGALRIYAGVQADRPVGYLVGIVVVLALITLCFHAAPTKTRAGLTTLIRIAGRHRTLSPSHSPSIATYGAAGAGMAVGLFGTAALFQMDPAFADMAGLPLERATSDSGSAGYSGDSGSSGGDSGGSSCGGGGGCGGGGCGG